MTFHLSFPGFARKVFGWMMMCSWWYIKLQGRCSSLQSNFREREVWCIFDNLSVSIRLKLKNKQLPKKGAIDFLVPHLKSSLVVPIKLLQHVTINNLSTKLLSFAQISTIAPKSTVTSTSKSNHFRPFVRPWFARKTYRKATRANLHTFLCRYSLETFFHHTDRLSTLLVCLYIYKQPLTETRRRRTILGNGLLKRRSSSPKLLHTIFPHIHQPTSDR